MRFNIAWAVYRQRIEEIPLVWKIRSAPPSIGALLKAKSNMQQRVILSVRKKPSGWFSKQSQARRKHGRSAQEHPEAKAV